MKRRKACSFGLKGNTLDMGHFSRRTHGYANDGHGGVGDGFEKSCYAFLQIVTYI
jgi:hypothetical protein